MIVTGPRKCLETGKRGLPKNFIFGALWRPSFSSRLEICQRNP